MTTHEMAKYVNQFMLGKAPPPSQEEQQLRDLLGALLFELPPDHPRYEDVRRFSLSRAERYMEQLEQIPVHSQSTRDTMFFVLDTTDECWIPIQSGELNEKNGWLTAVFHDPDGGTSTRPYTPGFWCHADADNNPSMITEYSRGHAVPCWRKK